jgi:uncharacterized protein (TIGR02996 family)
MSDRTAFYKAIWATPDDDLPRLAFADWLDEHAEPDAAHFLRLLSAARTCPPDVDRLRPLVADLRRTMVKLPPDFLRDACPVPPMVVVGPWVDPDHEANRQVLKHLHDNRPDRVRWFDRFEEADRGRLERQDLHSWRVVDRFADELARQLDGVHPCFVEASLSLVSVWSGVVVAVYLEYGLYAVRRPHANRSGKSDPPDHFTDWVTRRFGPDWLPGIGLEGSDDGDSRTGERAMLEATCRKFDPTT